jgi:hypothetical protein
MKVAFPSATWERERKIGNIVNLFSKTRYEITI